MESNATPRKDMDVAKQAIDAFCSAIPEDYVFSGMETVSEKQREEMFKRIPKLVKNQSQVRRRSMEEYVVKPPRPGSPKVFGYARVSTGKQYDHDSSIPAQSLRLQLYYKLAIEPTGAEWMGVLDDGKGVSARITPFMSRPAVQKILAQIHSGDHIVFDKMDRVFRDLKDFLYCSEWFQKNGITMHLLNLGGSQLQTSSPQGKLILCMLAALGQFEAETVSARGRESIATKLKAGLSHGASPPTGTKLLPEKTAGGYPVVWDVEIRKLGALVLHMRDVLHMRWCDIGREVSQRLAKLPGRLPKSIDKDVDANRKYAEILYHYEYFYKTAGITTPSMIPHRDTVYAFTRPHKLEVDAIISERLKKEAYRRKKERERQRQMDSLDY